MTDQLPVDPLAGDPLPLDTTRATDATVVGNKAAALASAVAGGLPVLPGFVLPTGWDPARPGATAAAVRAWRELSGNGRHPVVVRSSSTAEDQSAGSMAGRFESRVDVRTETDFLDAVAAVRASAQVVTVASGEVVDHPMAVLVQEHLAATTGGVLFGADPVTGRRGLVVAVAPGPPHGLVQGTVEGMRYVLGPRGRVRSVTESGDGARLSARDRRALARLARRAGRRFGAPQDIEWGIDADGRAWLLQSRPITALPPGPARPRRRRRVYGPGPVAETLPGTLSRLEAELWAGPLSDGVADALALAGLATSRQLRLHPPVIVTASGHVAADLRLLHALPRSRFAALDPRPALLRLAAAWQVGRLRSALPGLAGDVVAGVDERLAAVPALGTLTDAELLGTLEQSGRALRSVHGHEVLAGLLEHTESATVTGAEMALRALATGRAEGLDDDQIVARYPVTLALLTPAIGAPAQLPPVSPVPERTSGPPDEAAVLREALRLRARWLQELGARAAVELARRLRARGMLDDVLDVRRLSLTELTAAVLTGRRPAGGAVIRRGHPAPLPAAFVLRADGTVEPLTVTGDQRGTGAGGGRGQGRVHHGDGLPPVGSVLVVAALEPALAPLLPRLAGLVSETGSPLSHLAILAREMHVPTVVGAAGACARYPVGTRLTVDGGSGAIDRASEEVA